MTPSPRGKPGTSGECPLGSVTQGRETALPSDRPQVQEMERSPYGRVWRVCQRTCARMSSSILRGGAGAEELDFIQQKIWKTELKCTLIMCLGLYVLTHKAVQNLMVNGKKLLLNTTGMGFYFYEILRVHFWGGSVQRSYSHFIEHFDGQVSTIMSSYN